MPLKSRHDGQLRLSIANAPPPPEAKEPGVRRRAGDGPNEPDYWDARIRESLNLPARAAAPQPTQADQPRYCLGPKTATCEPTTHKPQYNADLNETTCLLCGAVLEWRVRTPG